MWIALQSVTVSLDKLKIPRSRTKECERNLKQNMRENGKIGCLSRNGSYYLKLKDLVDELSDIFKKCEEKCGLCDKYILQLHKHFTENVESQSELCHPFFTNTPNSGADESLPSFNKIQTNDDQETSGANAPVTSLINPAFVNVDQVDNFSVVLEAVDIKEEPDDMDTQYEEDPLLDMENSNSEDDLGKNNSEISSIPIKTEVSIPEDNQIPESPAGDKSNDGRQKRHKCDICGKSFGYATNLAKHRSVHSIPAKKRVSYKCETCGKSFGDSSNLRKHKRRHSSQEKTREEVDRIHNCEICGEDFVSINQLNGHMRKHGGYKKKVKTSLICDICGKSFGSKASNLRVHMLTHTGVRPYECDMCGKSYTAAHNLNVHKLSHTGEKRHKCDVCGKSYTVSFKLNIHKLTHTGEKRHKCDSCGKSYLVAQNLIAHMKVHEEGDKDTSNIDVT